FNMTEGLAQQVQRMRITPDQLRQTRLGLTILCEPSLHGTVGQPDLRGVDCNRQAVVVIERNRTAALYDPQQEPQALLNTAVREAGIQSPQAAQVIALE